METSAFAILVIRLTKISQMRPVSKIRLREINRKLTKHEEQIVPPSFTEPADQHRASLPAFYDPSIVGESRRKMNMCNKLRVC